MKYFHLILPRLQQDRKRKDRPQLRLPVPPLREKPEHFISDVEKFPNTCIIIDMINPEDADCNIVSW